MRPDEQILTGREDLVLLVKRKLFELYLSPGYQYTNNAFLSNNNRDSDSIYTLAGGIRFSTLIDNRISLSADLSATGARYNDNGQLDYNTIQGSLGAGYTQGSWSFNLSYSPSYVYDDDFDDHLVSLHRIAAFISRGFSVRQNVLVSPYISTQIVPTDPNEFGFYQGDFGIQAIVALPHNIRVSAVPRVYAKRYFDYFERQIGESRTDTGIGISANLDWVPHENVSFSAGASFTSNNSSLGGNKYDAFTATPSARFSLRF